ncbi:MAG: hypothetical protein LBT26_03125 [Clostridiales Family XIII bacterium]|jgi:tight adherence protein B|nr:hypothetical protein [Clostridiales Family XIII bacterium]
MNTDYNVYQMSQKEQQLYYIFSVLGLLMIGQVFYQSLLFSLVLTPLSIPARKYYARYLADRRKNALELSFRDLLYSLSASFATGRQMPEALAEGLDALRLIYPEDAPILRELEDMKKRIFVNREDDAPVLEDFARRSHIEDIRNFVDTWAICRTTGGDMERLVAKAAEVILDKMSIQKDIRTLTAQKRLEAKVLLLIPVFILVFLRIFSPDYTAVLYETLMGRLIMTTAAAVSAGAYVWSLHLTKVEI